MKIIVASEHEKIAIKKLTDALHDSCIEDIEDILQETYEVDSREISFYTSAFSNCKVLIESNENEVSIDTELIGICGECGRYRNLKNTGGCENSWIGKENKNLPSFYFGIVWWGA